MKSKQRSAYFQLQITIITTEPQAAESREQAEHILYGGMTEDGFEKQEKICKRNEIFIR